MQRLMNVIIVMLLSILLLAGCEEENTDFQEVSLEELEDKGVSEEGTGDSENIFVHVCGQVNVPGVYELPAGSRVYEAVLLAGGFTEKAAEDAMNQAQVLEDAQQLYVPSKEELEKAQTNVGTDSEGRVNLNHATREELMTLPGIGEAKAEAIIRYRNQQGDFRTIEEIMEIEGIKEGVFRKIEDQITVS